MGRPWHDPDHVALLSPASPLPASLKHDPETWIAIFGETHVPATSQSRKDDSASHPRLLADALHGLGSNSGVDHRGDIAGPRDLADSHQLLLHRGDFLGRDREIGCHRAR